MKVVIVGCGWLGTQLLTPLADSGYKLYVTRRSIPENDTFPSAVTPLKLQLTADLVPAAELIDIFHQAWVICAIAPGKAGGADHYIAALQKLTRLMLQAGSTGVIHFSSTSIYEGLSGDVTETAALDVSLPRVNMLFTAEQALQQLPNCITLRLSGLMGPGRHPGNFVAGKTLTGQDHPVNMIHSDDVSRVIQLLLKQNPAGPALYNLSCPHPVTKQEFYVQACNMLQTTPAVFAPVDTPGRRVIADLICQKLSFTYTYQKAICALTNCF